MEEKFRIKEYNEGQEEDKEEKYCDKNMSFHDMEQSGAEDTETDSDEIQRIATD